MVKILGHRGVRQRKGVDENSLKAFEAGFTEGDGIETDAVIASDKTPFLCHEQKSLIIPHLYSRSMSMLRRHLSKASAKLAGKRRIDEMTAAEVDALRLQNGAEIPRLAALFNLASKHPGKIMNIELKAYGSAAPVVAEIQKAVAEGKITKEQVILTSFDHAAIAEARRLDPGIKCGFIFARQDQQGRRIFPWTGDKDHRYGALNEKTLKGKAAQETQPDYFVMTPGQISARGMKQIRAHFPKAKIILWTSKNPEKYRGLDKALSNPALTPHIEAVITDFPDRMAKVLRKKGLRN